MNNREAQLGLDGVCTNYRLAGMIEAVDIKKLDMVSQFIEALFDVICGESEICPIANVFTGYMDVMNKWCGHIGQYKWIAADITRLRQEIQQWTSS